MLLTAGEKKPIRIAIWGPVAFPPTVEDSSFFCARTPVGLTSRGHQVTVDGGATLLTTICVSEGVPLTTTLRY